MNPKEVSEYLKNLKDKCSFTITEIISIPYDELDKIVNSLDDSETIHEILDKLIDSKMNDFEIGIFFGYKLNAILVSKLINLTSKKEHDCHDCKHIHYCNLPEAIKYRKELNIKLLSIKKDDDYIQ